MKRKRSNLVQFPCRPHYLTEEDLNDPCSGNVLDIPLPSEPTDELLEVARCEVMAYLDWVSHDWVRSYPGETWDEETLEETILEINGAVGKAAEKLAEITAALHRNAEEAFLNSPEFVHDPQQFREANQALDGWMAEHQSKPRKRPRRQYLTLQRIERDGWEAVMEYPLPLLPTLDLLDAAFRSFLDYPFFIEEAESVRFYKLEGFVDKLKEIARAYPGAVQCELQEDAELPDDPDVP